MLTPIQRLIKLNPTSAVLDSRVSTSEAYDPDAPAADPDDPDAPNWATFLTPVIGAFSGIKVEGTDYDATLTVDPEGWPAGADKDSTRVVMQAGDYGIKQVRPRMGFGRITGYTLELGL